ncbi:related to Choline kinase [Zygosaccharomyces bailii ISA1307]|uniref:ZYBA0S08-01640g1_1 n=1 Tax=Zygosaccharomyces bailii (strain CLIB 213 / ATCC 58445 / CBS 680 / BCRC 21525 / NBRC 1098 / NCYC 1416 / NRRL Y-2227) TaxID=1333698 RepID=A0A8J2X9E3_ZYGB2|nr:ZYBA0S08-01640g1_1 [Zygosaccharomyces bailii CLIB 213]CDH08914.1 related to Choline kinase [Zygosaccharomyces bailii ISA1307]
MPERRLSRSEVRINPFSVGSPHPHTRSRSPSRSSSRRRPSLTSSRTSQRLIRTISVDSDISVGEDEFTLETGESQLAQDVPQEVPEELLVDQLQHLKLGEKGTFRESEVVEVAHVPVFLDSTLPVDYFQEDVLNTIQNLRIPKWYVRGHVGLSPLDKNKLRLIRITGAMTNVIYKVEYSGLPSLLLRVYGPNIDTIIDREYELQVLARLSRRNIGPSLYGCFKNGRFEQFLENATTLGKDDIRDWKTSQRIARRMKELHMGVPLMKSERDQGPVCWIKIEKWLEVMEQKNEHWVANDVNVQRVLLSRDWRTFKEVVMRYKDWLFLKGFGHVKQGLVFCHNDTQYGNLLFSSPVVKPKDSTAFPPRSGSSSTTSVSSLFPESSNVSLEEIIHPTVQEQSQDSKLVVIDFEYAGANPAAYDLANHFCEWMYDYSCSQPYRCFLSQFPTSEQILNFLYSYVSHLRTNSKAPIDDEVKYYYNSIIRWRGTVQLFWSLWGILQSGQLDAPSQPDEEDRPSGGKYIFSQDEESAGVHENSDVLSEDSNSEKGVDIESFDYLGYSREKIALFWGDMIQFGLASEDECEGDVVRLDAERL